MIFSKHRGTFYFEAIVAHDVSAVSQFRAPLTEAGALVAQEHHEFNHANSRFNTLFPHTIKRPSATLNYPERPRNARLVRAKCSTVRRAGTLSRKLMIDIPIIEPTPNTAM